MADKVYKYDITNWIPSCESDTTDWISSVKTNGKLNTFVGICTSINVKNKGVTFSSHDYYLVRV